MDRYAACKTCIANGCTAYVATHHQHAKAPACPMANCKCKKVNPETEPEQRARVASRGVMSSSLS